MRPRLTSLTPSNMEFRVDTVEVTADGVRLRGRLMSQWFGHQFLNIHLPPAVVTAMHTILARVR